MNAFTLNGDCLEELKTFADNKFDSIVTDPPYGLSFMGKKWDYQVPSVDIWKECLRVLKPGGHLLSFSSARTYHRMVVNVEDAGFEIRDQIMWVYGSGFPKSHNIGKAVDKLIGNERQVIGQKTHARKGVASAEGRTTVGAGAFGEARTADVTQGSSDWEGWGTALKPAHEPIVLARKPISEKTIAANVLKWGTGAINIDKSRVPSNEPITINTFDNGAKPWGDAVGEPFTSRQSEGRFPANFIHDGSQQVLDLFPTTKSGKMGPHNNRTTDGSPNGIYGKFDANHPLGETYGDEGSAARFFYCAKTNKKERNQGCEGLDDKEWSHEGAAIPERSNRPFIPSKNNHPTVKPQKLMSYLVNLITPNDGVVLDPFMGSGSTGMAAVSLGYSFVGIELDENYVEIARSRIGGVESCANNSPR